MKYYEEQPKKLPVHEYDVVVAGAGTGGVVAAIAAARNGAKTIVIESKGYPGGIIVEGGTALHSFFNVWKPYSGVEKRQLVKGLPQEIIERLIKVGGCSGHAEMMSAFDYDCINTSIDTELYKVVAFEMMMEAGVTCMMNSLVVEAIVENGIIQGVIIENREGRQAIMAKSFIDATGHGDLCAFAGAEFTELCDYASANSIGMGGVNVDQYHQFLLAHNAANHEAYGLRSGEPDKLVRVSASEDGSHVMDSKNDKRLPKEFLESAKKIGMALVTTTVHDDYFMFIKLNYHIKAPSTDMAAVNLAELELRKRQVQAVELFRKYVPGCEKAFIARTSPSLSYRRGRTIVCDYDMKPDEIVEGTHYEDDIFTYGFHDLAPQVHIKDGRSYGLPYRALLVKGLENLYATGMMITTDFEAHMSTRNTVSCMGMGQAAGTAAAMCAKKECTSRELPYSLLRQSLLNDQVFLED